uniref:hypothetical protein n=1 Tax=Bartonella capreoli TaxID=155192 RepID=UPI001ABD1954
IPSFSPTVLIKLKNPIMASLCAVEANLSAYVTTLFSLLLKQIGRFSKLQQPKTNLFNSGTKPTTNFDKKSLYENFLSNEGILIDVETL